MLAHGTPCGRREQAVSAHPALVQLIEMIAAVAREKLVAALSGEHHLDLARGQAGNDIQGDAGRPGDGFVFVPDEIGEGVEEIRSCRA